MTTNLILYSLLLNSKNNPQVATSLFYIIVAIALGISYTLGLIYFYIMIPLYEFSKRKYFIMKQIMENKRNKIILKRSLTQYPTVSDYRKILE